MITFGEGSRINEGGILTFCVRFSFFNDDIVLIYVVNLQKGKINLGQIPCIYFFRPVLHPFPMASCHREFPDLLVSGWVQP